MIPYGKQQIDEEDIAAVVAVLRSDWLTTGPAVEAFEKALAHTTHQNHAVTFCNGTAALHAAMYALGIGPGDEVIVPAITFVATANAAVYNGAKPVFADVLPGSLLVDSLDMEKKITKRTKCLVAVDYAGHPCDYDALRALANKHGLPLLADSCHAIGGAYKDNPVGAQADISVFSFHPVKPITTAEGGAAVTNNETWAAKMRQFRGHGISGDFRQRERKAVHAYAMESLGYNFRLSDVHCALGASQLARLPQFAEKRNALANYYNHLFKNWTKARPLEVSPEIRHGWHLYIVQVEGNRDAIFTKMREQQIGVNVHYLPVYLHPYYQNELGHQTGECPVAEHAYEKILTLPLHVGMTNEDCERVVHALENALSA